MNFANTAQQQADLEQNNNKRHILCEYSVNIRTLGISLFNFSPFFCACILGKDSVPV